MGEHMRGAYLLPAPSSVLASHGYRGISAQRWLEWVLLIESIWHEFLERVATRDVQKEFANLIRADPPGMRPPT
jgi:hypothetical protein